MTLCALTFSNTSFIEEALGHRLRYLAKYLVNGRLSACVFLADF